MARSQRPDQEVEVDRAAAVGEFRGELQDAAHGPHPAIRLFASSQTRAASGRITELERRVNLLEDEMRSLHEENATLRARIAELEGENTAKAAEIRELRERVAHRERGGRRHSTCCSSSPRPVIAAALALVYLLRSLPTREGILDFMARLPSTNFQILVGATPDLSLLATRFRRRVGYLIKRCRDTGLGAVVYEGYRSPELQALYRAAATA